MPTTVKYQGYGWRGIDFGANGATFTVDIRRHRSPLGGMKPLERHLRRQTELPADFFWHAVRWRAVRGAIPHGSITLLDVGAGTGWLGRRLAADRPEVAYRFVEPISTLAETLEQDFGTAANGATDALISATAVTLLDVLEHQLDDVSFLADFVRRSNAGTTFIVTVPASMRLWSAWDVELGHHRRYTIRTLRNTLTSAGLHVLEASYLFPELWPVAAARRLSAPASGANPQGGRPEFRPLPRPINSVLRNVGAGTVAIRRCVPFGTSVYGVGRKPSGGSEDE